MSISENGKALYKETRRILRNAMNEKQLVLFVGSGASVDSGMPLWGKAVKSIADAMSLSDNYEDFLKIPQYYYNSRGKKEYTELMRSIFRYGDNLETTELHKKIIEFHTQTIITTNYDHLIEKAAEENSEVIQVISQDIDLPYKKSGRELIKMHGDFEHDNFVLKEDDYLHYSSNFKLIETYIKSLIGSKVVLFIGYSLNDPDVKHIISWVKEILNQNFQRAYMILSKKVPNDIEKEYFKNLGVNIIYTSELITEWNDPECTHSKQIIDVLEYILKKEKENILDTLYDNLKPLKELNYVYGKYIKSAFYEFNFICDGTTIDFRYYVEDKDVREMTKILCDYIESEKIPDGVDEEKLNIIKTVLEKKPFNILQQGESIKFKTLELKNMGINTVEDRIFSFDFQTLHNLLEQNTKRLSSKAPELYMQQAYISACLGEYYLAYNCLKSAATIFYCRKSYVWYFIAEFNRKYVGKLFENPVFGGINSNEREQIKIETDSIDLEAIINSIPDLGNNNNSFLRELMNFNIVHTLFYDVFADSMKASEQAKSNYSLFKGRAAYENLKMSVQDYNSFEIRNYLILDSYREIHSIFALYIRSFLAALNAEAIKPNSDNMTIGNIRPESLTDFDLYIMIKYMSKSQLKKLFKEYDIKIIPVDKNGLDYLDKICESVCMCTKYLNCYSFYIDIFACYLELIAHTEVSADLSQKILELLCEQSEYQLEDYADSINRLVSNICSRELYSNHKLCETVNQLIEKIMDTSSLVTVFSSLLITLSYFSFKGCLAYNNGTKMRRIANLENFELITRLYKNLGIDAQEPIRNVFLVGNPVTRQWIIISIVRLYQQK